MHVRTADDQYSRTDRGRELVAVLLPLVDWLAEHADEIVYAPGAAGPAEAPEASNGPAAP